MRIGIRILQGIGILVGMAFVYAAIVTFVPGFSVEKQPLREGMGKSTEGEEGAAPSYRQEVSFPVKGVTVRAWLYLPEELSTPLPCVVMGNGFGGTKDMLEEQYAVPYREAGFAVLAFDYRHVGESDGEPRQLLWIPYQLEDYAGAVAYVRDRKEIDPARIALWGTSLSGGHVIVTAAKDHNIACAVAQCPGLDGRASAHRLLERLGIGYMLKMIVHGQRDIFRSWVGLSPHKLPIVGKPGTLCLLSGPEAYELFKKHAPEDYVNEACARILVRGDKYRPVNYAKDVRCPVLLQVCEHDQIIPRSAAEETERQLGKYARAIYYPIGHFDIYEGENFDRALNDQLEFLKENL
jgi:pimeloyl-ACP methyl ester carboxylesterase